MFGIDTNLLVRYITQDGAEAPAVTRHLERECSRERPAFISLIVLCELVWVLRRAYKYKRLDVALILEHILMTDGFEVERSETAWRAWQAYRSGPADFSDYVIGGIAREYDAVPVHTLDRNASQSSDFILVETKGSL